MQLALREMPARRARPASCPKKASRTSGRGPDRKNPILEPSAELYPARIYLEGGQRNSFFGILLNGSILPSKCYAYAQDYPSSRKLRGDLYYFTTTGDRPPFEPSLAAGNSFPPDSPFLLKAPLRGALGIKGVLVPPRYVLQRGVVIQLLLNERNPLRILLPDARIVIRFFGKPTDRQSSEGISIAKDSIQPQVPLRLPCYDFTPVEDPTVGVTGGVYRARRFQLHVPELQRTIRTEAIFPDSLRLTALLPIVIAIVARPCGLDVIPTFLQYLTGIFLRRQLDVVAPVNSFEFRSCDRTPQAECFTHQGRTLIVYGMDYQGTQRAAFAFGVPSRGFFLESCHDRALDERALQAALPFFTHAILLDRAFAHCPRFPTAAPRGMWLIIRKDQLSIIGLIPTRYAPVRHFVLNYSDSSKRRPFEAGRDNFS
nr:unnamed protein product [Digitaria exilis]CAB3503732.1 unnamed protein product [Digitaria exilis]CAB3503892.1 unnamed protein product [Digitaria exilis]CAB3503980.1 unnamed protein product [Digitaria exilis]